jgi:hypothetical protein
LFNHSELLVTIRQLEYALMQMIQQTDELLTAIQYVMLGKLPMNWINPTTLQNILRNVSLQLPGGFHLILGTKTENVHLYYEIVKVTAIDNVHGIKLIINVPLKTASQLFTLYKISVLSTRISNSFVQYAIDVSQREYLLFTEADYHRCEAGKITICPANMAIYSVQIVTRESSISFQTSTNNRLCRRKLLFDYRTPTLEQHGTIWLYHLPEPREVTIRCLKNNI